MKVLYVFGGEKASGGEIVIKRLIDFNNASIDSHLIISPGKYATQLQEEHFKPLLILNELKKLNRGNNGALKLIIKMLFNSLSLSFKVISYVRKNEIKVIHANTLGPAFYLIPAVLFSKLFNNKLLWIWSDHDLKYHSTFDLKLAEFCSKLYNFTLAVSCAVKEKYNGHKVKVLYNGLNTNQFFYSDELRHLFRKKFQIASDLVVIGLAGFVDERKGQLMLAKVVKQIQKKYNNILLIFVGRPIDADSNYYKLVLEEIENSSCIKFLGQIENMPDFYCGCDIIISNSSKIGSEPLGTTIYEAMACEKLVLASNTGGTPEIVDNNINGFLFEPDSPESLHRQLDYVLENIMNFEQIKRNARQKVIEKFNIQKMSSKYLRILECK